MKRQFKLSAITFSVLISSLALATELPSACRQLSGFVAQLDCLQDQQDLLSRLLQIEQTKTQIEVHRLEREELNAPPMLNDLIAAGANEETDIVAEQIAWFDQQLQVYAVIGNGETMTAYARLGGREYRLQEGDWIHLARVSTVHARGIELLLYEHTVEVGLAGRATDAESGKEISGDEN